MSLQPLFDEGLLVTFHALAALTALFLGIFQIVRPKGTGLHRMIGYIWVTAIISVAISSFWISSGFRMVGPFSPIHLLSIFTLVMVTMGIIYARRGQIRNHKRTMIQLFWFALVVTGGFTLLPGRIMHQVVFGG